MQLEKTIERAILIGLYTESGEIAAEVAERSLDELQELAEAAGATVVGRALQHRQSADSATFIGKGKLEEAKAAAIELDASLLIFDDELTGSQIRNIEGQSNLKVVDRTFLILDIFAQRAKSREGKLQVELAQQQYRLSRLIGLGHALSRLGGGIGTRGPGESQLESDRRHINRRLNTLKQALKEVALRRQQTRQQRQSNEILTIAVVGYTNAGKSTLLNILTQADLLTLDQVFATLDPAARRLELPDQQPVILVDTVGFIRKLPHQLVDAFRSTLEEVTQADAILQVIDCSDPQADVQRDVVEQLLNELGAAGKPRLTVLNKIDRLGSFERGGLTLFSGRDQTIQISARTGEGIPDLIAAISKLAAESFIPVSLLLPYAKTGWVSRIEQQGKVDHVDYREDGIAVEAHVRVALYKALLQDQLLISNDKR
ncbi:MAG: GTPase HflX [Eubacteriales bacterium]|nr:GTPase HflX [Eubacteriales bacterium]